MRELGIFLSPFSHGRTFSGNISTLRPVGKFSTGMPYLEGRGLANYFVFLHNISFIFLHISVTFLHISLKALGLGKIPSFLPYGLSDLKVRSTEEQSEVRAIVYIAFSLYEALKLGKIPSFSPLYRLWDLKKFRAFPL